MVSALGLEDNRVPSSSTRSVLAHDAYLRGVAHFCVPTVESLRAAVKDFDESISLDPNFTRAYAELGTTWGSIATQVGGDQRDAVESSRRALQKAIALNPNLPSAHAALGILLTNFGWQPSAAEAEFKRALELSPSEPRSISGLASLYANLGRLDEAVRLVHKAVEVNPLSALLEFNLASYLIPLGRFEEAEHAAWRAINLQPSGAGQYALLTIIDIERGDKAAALRHATEETDEIWRPYAQALATSAGDDKLAADQAMQTFTQKYGDDAPSLIADVHALRGEPDRAFEWLNKAHEVGDPGANSVLYTPFLLRYRTDPRFIAYCRKLGLTAPAGKI